MTENRFGPCPNCQMGGPDAPGICVLPQHAPVFSGDMAGNALIVCHFCGMTFEQSVAHGGGPPPPPPSQPSVPLEEVIA